MLAACCLPLAVCCVLFAVCCFACCLLLVDPSYLIVWIDGRICEQGSRESNFQPSEPQKPHMTTAGVSFELEPRKETAFSGAHAASNIFVIFYLYYFFLFPLLGVLPFLFFYGYIFLINSYSYVFIELFLIRRCFCFRHLCFHFMLIFRIVRRSFIQPRRFSTCSRATRFR